MDGPSSRRRFLRSVATAGVAGLAGCGQTPPTSGLTTTAGQGSSPDRGTATPPAAPESVGLETIVSGLRAPTALTFADDGRGYLAEQTGVVHRLESGQVREEPVLDLRESIEVGGEKGLLGLALHPEFATNRRLFVRYSAPPRSNTPASYSHTFVLAEFEATADGRRVSPDSERSILEIPEPQSNHNAGDIAFGPDGLLYVPVGDGGAGGDQGAGHVQDWYHRVAGGNGQDVTGNLLGSVLRIDVDRRSGDRPYAIPDDNPLLGGPGLDEHYAWGFRNPWRLSFDGADLLVGDVGQNRYEEVDLVRKGGNYGWNVREGTHCYGANSCPDRTPKNVRGGEKLLDPVVEYPHEGSPVSGFSVIGGYVYRGSALPALQGTYVFGDLAADGRLFAATPADGDGLWPTRTLPIAEPDRQKLRRLFSFGRDRDGELYALGTGTDGGGVHRLVRAD